MILQLKEVVKNYQQADVKIEVLKQVNLAIDAGQTLAILGQSGSGKSTLLSMISGLDRPTKGEVIFLDHKLHEMSESEITEFRGKHMGIIFQQFHLLPHLTALENVRLPIEIAGLVNPEARALEALEQVGLGHRVKHRPQELSGGECQRVAIARALVMRPQLLLADEPSGNLDVQTGEQVMSLLFEVVQKNKMTLLLVTHSQELAKRCQKQVVLEKGRI
jgi:putative ABC transport system ATP-binding protein